MFIIQRDVFKIICSVFVIVKETDNLFISIKKIFK